MLRVTSTLMLFFVVSQARADVGDPQLKTDHPWYPGESLSISRATPVRHRWSISAAVKRFVAI